MQINDLGYGIVNCDLYYYMTSMDHIFGHLFNHLERTWKTRPQDGKEHANPVRMIKKTSTNAKSIRKKCKIFRLNSSAL